MNGPALIREKKEAGRMKMMSNIDPNMRPRMRDRRVIMRIAQAKIPRRSRTIRFTARPKRPPTENDRDGMSDVLEKPSTTGGSSISGMESSPTSRSVGSSEWGGTDPRGIEDLEGGGTERVADPC